MNLPVHVGLIGSQFISTIHAESLQKCPQAVLTAVASPTPGNAEKLAKHFGIPTAYLNYRQLLENPEIQMVVVGAPNDLHCQIVVDAAAAGKHVVIEKPLCLNLAEADQMIAACRKAGVKLMYAEELPTNLEVPHVAAQCCSISLFARPKRCFPHAAPQGDLALCALPRDRSGLLRRRLRF